MKAVAIGGYTSGEKFIAGCLPSDVCVAIDNGHGDRFHTIGKRSPDGRYYEGEWSRVVSTKLKKALEEMGFNAWLVVPEKDVDVPLLERCRRANEYMKKNPDKYHIFISLHTNAAGDKSLDKDGWCNSATGLEVYCSTKASEASKVLAHNVYKAGVEMGLKGNRAGNDYKTANFTVITDTKMPAILTESAFHTNKADVDYLLSDKGQEDIVNYHVAGVCKTFGIPYSIVKA